MLSRKIKPIESTQRGFPLNLLHQPPDGELKTFLKTTPQKPSRSQNCERNILVERKREICRLIPSIRIRTHKSHEKRKNPSNLLFSIKESPPIKIFESRLQLGNTDAIFRINRDGLQSVIARLWYGKKRLLIIECRQIGDREEPIGTI